MSKIRNRRGRDRKKSRAWPDADKLIKKLRLLRWTQEIRPGHPWRGQPLVNQKQVEELIKEEFNGN